MRIREATPADGDAIRGIVADALAEFGFPLESSGIDGDLADIPLGYHRLGGVFRVIVDDSDNVVGCGGLYPVQGGAVELRKMYFRPQVRGRGMGRKLLENLISEARVRGYSSIELETSSNMAAALSLYERAGFAETNAPRHSARCDRTLSLPLR